LTHTVLGPDHYLPFVMLARARGWTMARTLVITAICGLGHVASSLLVGGIGLSIGVAVGGIESLETGRGDLAAWAIVAFGLAYATWGVRRALRSRHGIEPHKHHGHVHVHSHGDDPHDHDHGEVKRETTFWALFVVFALGPCEPLIPLFVLPASRGAWPAALLAAVVFGVVTILTMLVMTALALAGVKRLSFGPLEKWSHTMAGAVIAASGMAILFLGL
jgi:hypothetical protein